MIVPTSTNTNHPMYSMITYPKEPPSNGFRLCWKKTCKPPTSKYSGRKTNAPINAFQRNGRIGFEFLGMDMNYCPMKNLSVPQAPERHKGPRK